jgi:hypothetical protein
MWGNRGPFLPAASMVSYGYVGHPWLLQANIRLTYRKNSKNCLLKIFLFLRRNYTFLASDSAAIKRDLEERKLVS